MYSHSQELSTTVSYKDKGEVFVILLAAVNAKYIHSNLAVYSLKRYTAFCDADIQIKEFTINQSVDSILSDIYRMQPEVVAFSCYLWNIDIICTVAAELKKLLPEVKIWAGGPEVSYHPKEQLEKYTFFDLIMYGEGEKTFQRLAEITAASGKELRQQGVGERSEAELTIACEKEIFQKETSQTLLEKITVETKEETCENYSAVAGVVYRDKDQIVMTEPQAPLPLDEIPFPYPWLVREAGLEEEFENTLFGSQSPLRHHNPESAKHCFDTILSKYDSVPDIAHRIVYYESSRGCPFSCSYCLSSIEKGVRLRSLELVKMELAVFLKLKVPQVKFIDRTFNCNKAHAMAIWRYLAEHDNGVTNFHFEIAADILTEEELQLLSSMRNGLVQLEIGVQSTNPETISAIHRTMNLERLSENVKRIYQIGNIHQHLDLIAGLPKEDFESFGRSFDDIYRLHPDQLQLGFLKILKGACIEAEAEKYQIQYREYPPYEVLSTHVLSYGELLLLKQVEEMVEIYYNSGQFLFSVFFLEQFFERPFELYRSLGEWYEKKAGFVVGITRLRRYELLLEFFEEVVLAETEESAGSEKMRRSDHSGSAVSVSDHEQKIRIFRELLVIDLYQRENLKKRPVFASDRERQKGFYRGFYESKSLVTEYLSQYKEYQYKQQGRMTHLEGICFETARIMEDCRNQRHYTGVPYRVISSDKLWDQEMAAELQVDSVILFYYDVGVKESFAQN